MRERQTAYSFLLQSLLKLNLNVLIRTSVSVTFIKLSEQFIEGRAGAVYAVEKPTAHDPNEIVSEANT